MSQASHGYKWLHEVPDHMLTPMVEGVSNGIPAHYYVNELLEAQVADMRYWFIPHRFFSEQDPAGVLQMWAKGHRMRYIPGEKVWCKSLF